MGADCGIIVDYIHMWCLCALFFCREGVNGEVVFMFMTKNVITYPFFSIKIEKAWTCGMARPIESVHLL